MKKLNTILGIVAAAATLTFGIATAEAQPSTVAIRDLKLVGEKASTKPSAEIRVIGIVGHGGGGGGGGGGRGNGGYYGHGRGNGGGYYGHGRGNGGGYYGHGRGNGGGYYGHGRGGRGYYGRNFAPANSAAVSPQIGL